MVEPKVTFIKRNEPVLVSWARDIVSFGSLIGTAVAMNTLIEPSGWLNATIGITWMLWMLGRGQIHKVTMTPEEARNWLDREYPQERSK